MIRFLRWFIGLFSPYVNSFERKVDKFFTHITSTDSASSVRSGLLKLMKEDMIVTNVWMEKRFKGYLYLDKKARRQMYENTKKLVSAFDAFCAEGKQSLAEVLALLNQKGLKITKENENKMLYLFEIMSFLRPGKHYNYIKTASFGKLLRDPSVNKLEGDCNQIVTLYIYLYGLKFPMEELQIKLLKEHVCLHFKGIDIEATNGTFQKYEEFLHVLPVTEIISTNMLDLADFREDAQHISPRIIVKSAQLAYAISSLKSVVAKNLDIAYRNLAISAMKSNDFSTAVFYADMGNDIEVKGVINRNAAIYYMKKDNFEKAGYFAGKLSDSEFMRAVKRNEGIYCYKKGNLDKALSVFNELGDEEMKKAVYGKQYNELARKVSGVKTLNDAKKHRSTYKKMLELARRIGDSKLIFGVEDILKKM